MSKKKRKEIVLNEEQEEAKAMIQEFLKSDEIDFTLSGRAGTGKSTLMFDIFKRKKPKTNEYYIPKTIIGITVTHQARINLMQHIPNCTTFASAANLEMVIDPNGEIYFVERQTNLFLSELRAYKILIIDECSMFDKKMIGILRRCCDPKAKIIWTGDHHQLPPVGVTNDEDSPTFSFKNKFTLNKVMRQSEDNYILDLADQICEQIDGDKDLSFIKELKNKFNPETNKGYAVTTIQNVITSFVSNFKNKKDVRITSYRNKRINQINDMIRTFLWDDKSFNKFVVGEFIVMADQFAPMGIPRVFNGQTFFVEDITTETIEGVECDVLKVNNGTKKKPEWEYLPVPSAKGILVYKKTINLYKEQAKITKNWKDYMEFKNNFANVAYGYAVSNYKIQGATTYGCYVDLSDILDTKTTSNKRKLQAFYVGVSRPTNVLAIF